MTAQDRDVLRLLEMSVVGACIERPQHIEFMLERCPLEHFGTQTFYLAATLGDLATDEKPIDPNAVLMRLQRRGDIDHAGGATFVYECMVLGHQIVDVQANVDTLARIFVRRETWALGQRLTQAAGTLEVDAWLPFAEAQVEHIKRVVEGTAVMVPTHLSEVLTSDLSEITWTIPHLLAEGSSTMLVAEEGVGKSTVLRQLAMAAMCGIQPFDTRRDRYEPRRVLLIDCEVSRRRLYNELSRMWAYARRLAPTANTELMAVESHQRGLNLSDVADQAWLHRLVRAHRPDLVVIGPVYRFTEADNNTEEGVRSWQRLFEPMLSDGVTVVTEHHAPNQQEGKIRALRPIGSSVIRRWFSQGIALRTKGCSLHGNPFCQECLRKAVVESWRGSRDEDTRWPRYLEGEHGEIWWVRDEGEEIYRRV